MLKKFSKLLFLSLVIFAVASFSVCFATEAVTTSEAEENSTATISSEENAVTKEDTTHYGDLYLFDTSVVIDNIVYGNVYVIANTVEITGQIEGNLFVLANTLKLDSSVSKGGLVGGSIFACANSIYYNGACTYLYAMSNNIEMTYDSYVVRDAKMGCLNANIKAAIGRDIYLDCITVNFGEGEDVPLFYGNLNYSSLKKADIPDKVVTGNIEEQITYRSPFSYSLVSILIGFVSAIITVLILYVILNKITPRFVEKISSISVITLLKAFGIGLLSIIIVSILAILLLVTVVGLKLSIILALLFAVLCFISVPVLSIAITKALKPALKLEKVCMFLLVLSLVSVILYGLTLIPFAGIILSFIIKVTAIGLIIYNYLPHKELTDEEKAEKAEAKRLAKEEKERRKQEKLELKAAKELEKAELNNSENK